MTKQWNPRKQTVELQEPARPSRIRRELVTPPPDKKPGMLDRVDWHSREMEIAFGIAGILLFALAIDLIALGISAITGS